MRDVINGKLVFGEAKEIQEVKNAYNAYEKIAEIDPYSIEELKKFHPSLDVNEAEDAIYNRDFTDVTDILKELINDEKKKRQKS